MVHQVVKLILGLSLCLLAVSGVLFMCSMALNPWDHFLSLNDSFHVGLQNRSFDARIMFFNNAEYGPYRGSLIGVQDASGKLYPPLVRQYAFGNSWGIYYRDFQWSDSRLWTFTFSLWYPLIVFAIAPLVVLSRRLSRSRNLLRA